jgi:uncharacterized protein (TIGR03118 family)
LVSDQTGAALHTDARLVNSWGLAFNAEGLLYVADNGPGLSTLYTPSGFPLPLSIQIPPPTGGMDTATPSGLVSNPSHAFVVTQGAHSGSARFLFATEDGTISAWTPVVSIAHAILAVDNSASATVYKGIAVLHTATSDRLYATDFHNRKVDVFDGTFTPVQNATAFVDSGLPSDYAPFGIREIGGLIVVTYAKQKPPLNHDDDAGPGHGFIDVFQPDGTMVKRLVTMGELNSPWGLAKAPAHFGAFSNALLVGNFGDGSIHAYDPSNGNLLGTLSDSSGAAIAIDGLWGLTFRPVPNDDEHPGQGVRLYFTAGPGGENHGLMGFIRTVGSSDD